MDYSDVTLILPTLNERRTAPLLIRKVAKSYPGISIIVVDDGSTDGTRQEVGRIARSDGSVRLIDRSSYSARPGLTGSIMQGIERSETKFTVVMDADMQHPIEKIGEIVDGLDRGASISVCYRQAVKDWPLHRRIISRALSNTGYLVLVLRKKKRCRDIFSGFFGVRTSFARRIISQHRRSFVDRGYKFLFDMLKCIDSSSDVGISEIPYSFGNRKYGASKAGPVQVLALLRSFLS